MPRRRPCLSFLEKDMDFLLGLRPKPLYWAPQGPKVNPAALRAAVLESREVTP